MTIKAKTTKSKILATSCLALNLLGTAWASGDDAAAAAAAGGAVGVNRPSTPVNPASVSAAAPEDVIRLKAQLEEQLKQLEQLRAALEAQKKILDQMTAASPAAAPDAKSDRLVASTTPMVPISAIPAQKSNLDLPRASSEQAAVSSPLQIRIGDVGITPVGFLDITSVWRDKDAGSSIGSNFGSIPYNNVTQGHLSEFRFSPQNSRLGFRVDGTWKGTRFLVYNEFDFLGTSGANNLDVTNGAFVPRLRLFWVDLRKGNVEFLGGQSWSMLTPNRKGISALPGDLFYSQTIDVNYMAGLPWDRQAGVRVLIHGANDKVTFGFSAEQPNQYIGGSAGGSSVVLPSALATYGGTEFENNTNVLVAPNLHPDFIAKIAFDPNARFHGEVAGIERTFKAYNPTTNQTFTKAGGGASVNLNFGLTKDVRLLTNNYWSDGGGRYLFGQVPDVTVRSDGSISPIHAGGTVDGIEATFAKNFLVYAYYGAIYAGRNVAIDANGTSLVGYGYRGSANSQNRAIQEFTIGFNQTLWRDARYGAVNAMGQYEYLTRAPWFVAAGAPKATHDNTIYFNLRYTLPGSAPATK